MLKTFKGHFLMLGNVIVMVVAGIGEMGRIMCHF